MYVFRQLAKIFMMLVMLMCSIYCDGVGVRNYINKFILCLLVGFPLIVFFTFQNVSDGALCILLVYLIILRNGIKRFISKKVVYLLVLIVVFVVLHLLSIFVLGGEIILFHGYYFRFLMIIPLYLLFNYYRPNPIVINWIFIVTILFSLLVGVYQRYILHFDRAGSPFFLNHGYYPINWGDTLLLISLYLFLAWAFSIHRTFWLVLGSCTGLVCSLLSGSRGGWLGLIVVVFVWYLLLNKKSLLKNLTNLLILVMILMIVIVTFQYYNILRVGSAYNDLVSCLVNHQCISYTNGGENSLGLRFMMWSNAIKLYLLESNYWFGCGLGMYSLKIINLANNGIIPQYFATHYNEEPHNEILRILVMLGITGLLSYFSIFMYLFTIIRGKSRRLFILVMIVFWFASFSQALLIAPISCDILVYVIALVLYLNDLEKKQL